LCLRSSNDRAVMHAGGVHFTYALPICGRILVLDKAPQAGETEIVTLHLDQPEMARAWTSAVDAGAVVADPLESDHSGLECGVLEDPFGHLWSLVCNRPTDAQLDLAAARFTPLWPVPTSTR
jgi:uncharacterized glyoxalase superfamily protein PhnB